VVVRRAGLKRRGHEHVDARSRFLRGGAGHVLNDQKVGPKRKVRPVLLGRANRQDRQGARGTPGSLPAVDLVQEEPG
jgi:hypothetical protein